MAHADGNLLPGSCRTRTIGEAAGKVDGWVRHCFLFSSSFFCGEGRKMGWNGGIHNEYVTELHQSVVHGEDARIEPKTDSDNF